MSYKLTKYIYKLKNLSILTKLASFFILSILVSIFIYKATPEVDSTYLGTNIFIFGLLNINLLLIIALLFIFGRVLFKIFFDRKNKILGSKIRSKLVLSFLSLAFIPSVIIFFLASGLLNQAIGGWFNSQVENNVQSALEVGREHLDLIEKFTFKANFEITNKLKSKPLIYKDFGQLQNLLDDTRDLFSLYSISLINSNFDYLLISSNLKDNLLGDNIPEFDKEKVLEILKGETKVFEDVYNENKYIRVFSPSIWNEEPVVVESIFLINSLVSYSLRNIESSFNEYSQLKLFRGPLQSGYLLTLSLVTCLIIFAAAWIGMHIAKEISVPIGQLVDATERVKKGDLDHRVKMTGDDEISQLIKSFNEMTTDLKASKEDAEKRRIYLETILSNLAVGVISIDKDDQIININSSCFYLFNINSSFDFKEKQLSTVLDSDTYNQVQDLIVKSKQIEEINSAVVQKRITVIVKGVEKELLCSVGKILDNDNNLLAQVIIFDDLSELVKAQKSITWRDAARRIAHEIKNPLTPIQLSAQRLDKLLSNQHPEIKETVDNIVNNVSSIKRLADEFSQFARMPTAVKEKVDIANLINGIISPIALNQDLINIQTIYGDNISEVLVDKEQIGRLVINLVENAKQSLIENKIKNPKIIVKVRTEKDNLILIISDNGKGITIKNKSKIFDPYYTTKTEGAGLGLAIVNTIVNEHFGTISVKNLHKSGAEFKIEIPLEANMKKYRNI